MSHTKTPWKVVYNTKSRRSTERTYVEGIHSDMEDNGIGCSYNICETDSGCYGPKAEDAEYIVHCVNNFAVLEQQIIDLENKLFQYQTVYGGQ